MGYGLDPDEGSSPLARGALLHHHADLLALGIIPACAGSTCTFDGPVTNPKGSSPLARGALLVP